MIITLPSSFLITPRIQIGLPVELATGTTYLGYYIEYILAVQERYSDENVKLPLCIMTSADTNAGTVKLLEANDYFGMDKEQVTIVQQGDGVPALSGNNARIALDPSDPYKVLTKPHGHGDVHSLLYKHGVAKKWVSQGIKWITFFQVRGEQSWENCGTICRGMLCCVVLFCFVDGDSHTIMTNDDYHHTHNDDRTQTVLVCTVCRP